MQQKRGIDQYKNGFNLTLAPNRLKEPFSWKSPKIVFVNSMSDLFHEDVPDDYISEVFTTMNKTDQHIYQVLTKRIDRVISMAKKLNWSKNIWLGVSVESNAVKKRIDDLRKTPASIKFISFEPLLEDLTNLNLSDINWVIVGGESGSKARRIEQTWIVNILRVSRGEGIPYFFKQWGKTEFNPDQQDPTISKHHIFHSRGGCMLNKKVIREFPRI